MRERWLGRESGGWRTSMLRPGVDRHVGFGKEQHAGDALRLKSVKTRAKHGQLAGFGGLVQR